MNFADNVKDSTITEGTGIIVLAGAPPVDCQGLAAVGGVGATFPYSVAFGAERESGIATITSLAGGGAFARTFVTSSSNNDELVPFSAGTKIFTHGMTADIMAKLAGAYVELITSVASLSTTTVYLEESGISKRITLANLIATIGVATNGLAAASALSGPNLLSIMQDGVEVQTNITTLAAAIQAINGATDTAAPAFVSALVADAAKTVIVMTFGETLAAFTPAAAAFAVSGGKTVSSVARSGATISLTVNAAYAYGDAITVTYTKPGTNMIRDAAGNETASFGPTAVSNNIANPGDVTAPTASSAAVANGSPTVVAITMNEAMDGTNVPAAGAFTVSGHTVSSVAISGSTISLTCSAAFVNGEAARTVSYTQPGTSNARDAAGNLLANFSALAITNNVAVADTAAPTFSSALVADATPTIIAVTMSETMANIVPVAGAFTVSGGKTVTGVSITGAVVSLTCSAAYANGDTITVTYTKPGSGNVLQDPATNETVTFGPSSVTNNVATSVPIYILTGPPAANAAFNQGPTSATLSGAEYNATQSVNIYVKTAAGVAAPAVKFVWSKSSTVPPIVYGDTGYAGHGNSIGIATKTGSWTTSGTSYYGLWGKSGFYAWELAADHVAGTPWYLWIITSDGARQAYDNATGTPIGWVLN